MSGDILWIAIVVIFGIVSVLGKASARQQQQQNEERRRRQGQQWPGPVAGPRPGQGPTWAPSPGPRPTTARPMPTLTPTQTPPAPQKQEVKREAPKSLVSGDVFTRSLDTEGYSSEGYESEGQSVEGPAPGEDVEGELSRFSRETELMERRHLTELTDDLIKPEKGLYGVAEEQAPVEVQSALADPGGVARSIVLAEVLGRPKSLQGRGFNSRRT